jgi:hypothetical protein
MAYARLCQQSNIPKRKRCNRPRRTPILEQPLPENSTPPTLSEDENLVLALRLRDGVPNAVPHHRRTGACKYANVYKAGDCDWCKALDRREEAAKPAEANSNVIVMSLRFQQAESDALPMRRIA